MRIEEQVSGDVRIVRLSGELDATDVPEITARLDASAAGRVVLNLEGVRFTTVAVLGSLVRAQERIRRRGGTLALSAPSRFVERLVHALGLERTLTTYPRDDEAIDPERSHAPLASVP